MDTIKPGYEELKENLSKSEMEKYRLIVETAGEGIWITDAERKTVFVNQKMADMLGYTIDEMSGRAPMEFLYEDQTDHMLEARAEVETGKNTQREFKFKRKDSSALWAISNASPMFEADGCFTGVISMLIDITERRKKEEELYKVNRTLKALGKSSHAMMRFVEEAGYLREICRIIVEDCGHAMVWIGYAEDDESRRVRPVAHAGFEAGYIETLNITWDDTPLGRGPTGTAIRTGKPAMCRNMLTDPEFAPWRDEALKRGYRSSIVLPLVAGAGIFGAINIYSRDPDPFSEDEVKLLSELADDLAYGISAIRLRAAKIAAEESQRISEERFRGVFENAAVGIAYSSTNGQLINVNKSFCNLMGYPEDELIGMNIREFNHPDDLAENIDMLNRLLKGEFMYYSLDKRNIRKDGSYIWVNTTVSIKRSSNNDPLYFVAITQDITARKKAEEELEKSEKRFRSLTENAPDIILRQSPDLRFIYLNPEIFRATGILPEEYIGKTNEEIGMPEDFCNIWNNAFQKAREDRKIQEIEFEFSGPMGRKIYNSRIVPEFTKDGSLESYLSISRDVTEDKKIRQEFISTQNYLNKLLDYANAPIIVWDTRFRITRFNRASERLTNYKAGEVIGKELSMLFPEYSKNDSLNLIKRTLEGEYWEVVEIPILRKDGDIRISLWNSANIYAQDGKTHVATIAQGQDITERKRAEKELEMAASFPGENPNPVMRIDWDGVLQFANPASRQMLEAWNSNVGESLLQHISEPLSRAFSSDSNEEREIPINDQIFLTTFAPFKHAGYMNIYAMDITKRKHAEEEVIKARDELEKRVQERTEQLRLLAMELTQAEQRERKRLAEVLHDNLQQLLVGAKWDIQSVQKKTKDRSIDKSLGQAISLLDKSVKVSKSLISELSPPILHEAGLVAAVKWLSRWMKESYGLSVTVRSKIEIETDNGGICILLFQSVRELLFNVVKHSTVKAAWVSISIKNNRIQIRVSDKGRGFDPAKKKFAAKDGFGLFSIKERISLLGGDMAIDSAPGSGTRVLISVPVPEMPEAEAKPLPETYMHPGEKKISVQKQDDSKIRVLVADDHSIVREGICELLRSIQDIEIIGEASDGKDAVDKALKLQPDIVIMDVNMPRLNGIEATRRILANIPDIRVICLSMHEEEDMAIAMRNAGAVDYIHKADLSQRLISSIRANCRLS